MNFRADLHVHSTCSDGTDAPRELLRLAKEVGLSGLSITDHDTIRAYEPSLFAEAERLGIKLLVGAEVSSGFQGASVHVLAYGFQPLLAGFLDEVIVRRDERNLRILENLKKLGIAIELSELKAKGTAGRPHIAEILVERKKASSLQDAFDRYLNDKAPCYVPGNKFSPAEVIDAIHQASGKAVLAHPHLIRKGVQELLTLPFDGIECYYGLLRKEQEAPWVALAKKRGWIATGGSDYHGRMKPHIPLGCSWVSEETFLALRN